MHKFGRRGSDNFDQFITELEATPGPTVGDLIVFVDECHRTQSGKLHRVMKATMPDALFIGFTGTPLLKQDSATSREVFGGYIHTYQFGEAVADKVVLDLVYEARDIDQQLTSPAKVDAWVDAKTRGLNEWQRDELKKHWGTLQQVLSSRSRMGRVVADIVYDFAVRPRLNDGRGNAMLVASSIYEACKYFELFQQTTLRNHCAIITSYNPQARDVSREETGANSETDRQFIYQTYTRLLAQVAAEGGHSAAESYEEQAKAQFVREPATMKLLIVVDKLLTGFDAPPCSALYIDKKMQDHGLFQAICRTNRLAGDDKVFGYIVDYKDLFRHVETALAVYTTELDQAAGATDPQILLRDRFQRGRERLDGAVEALVLLLEPIAPPVGELEAIRYFCGNTEIVSDLQEREPRRVALYKATVALVRAYAAVADDMARAGYSSTDVARIAAQLAQALALRETIRRASGETLDLKAYEADMRHLIDTYIQAAETRVISQFAELPLLDIIARQGIDAAISALPAPVRNTPAGVAETIENNVRSTIIQQQLNDPAFYDKMSELLDEIIADRKTSALAYEAYLVRIAALAAQVAQGHTDDTPEPLRRSAAIRALYNNLRVDRAPVAGQRAGGPATYAVVDTQALARGSHCHFTTAPQLIRWVRDGYAPHDASMRLTQLTSAGLLIIDDLGVERGSEADRALLADVLHPREAEQRPTVITTNLDSADIEPRLADRIAGSARVVQLLATSYRRERPRALAS